AEYEVLASEIDRSYRARAAEMAWPIAYYRGVAGQWDAALAAAADGVANFRKLAEKESTGAMEGLLAEVHDFLGQHTRAWQHHVNAFAFLSDAGDPYRLQVALAGASRPYLRQQNWSAAIALLDLEIERSDFPENINLRADAMARRARVRAARGDRAGARADLILGRAAAARVADPAARAKLIADLDEASGIVERDENPPLSVCLLTNAISFYETAERRLLLPELFLERGRSYRASAADDLALADFDAGLAHLEEQRATLSEFESATTFSDPAADLFIEAVRLAVRRGDTARAFEYSERSRGRALARDIDSAVDLTPVLPSAVVVVEYMVLPEQLVIFTLGRELRMTVSAIHSDDLEKLVQRLTTTIAGRASSVHGVQQASAALRNVLLGPIETEISDASTLVFVPNRFLERVPWAALYDIRSGRYLFEETLVLTEPSVRAIRRHAGAATRRPPAKALVIGNPRSASPLFDTLPSLVSAESEARNVAAVYSDPVLLLGSDATRERVLRQVTRFEALHFASHAVSSVENDGESFLVLASDDPAGSSGLLHARDIARLDLSRTRLVVLAACGTLRGTTVHLDGMPSIARSFLAAGASSVVATLWDIDDERASALFSQLHKRVADGSSTASALREVQLQALRSNDAEIAHPKTWAGITLVGGLDP
ncbi:MAG TPA: CHAT domain-containing protein, partial [Thermoanaerobaculia bacterium]|nr:CHAT domain-containing protein [Thermoanaerobaculia bacterium]